MGRNSSFGSRLHPFSNQTDLQLKNDQVAGPSRLFNPTRARYDHLTPTEQAKQGTPSGLQFQWRSRDNRKGRHTLVVPANVKADHLPPPTTSSKAVLRGISRMFTTFPWWDVSFLVAFLFSVGCILFIVCGLFYWLPLAYPSITFPHESGTAGGITAFIGGTLFEIGAVLLVIEAVNENQTGCFGWELEHALSKHDHDHAHTHEPEIGTEKSSPTQQPRFHPSQQSCSHAHCPYQSRSPFKSFPGTKHLPRKWSWWPTYHEFRTHYIHELGFLGSFAEFVGATIYYINCIMSLPGVYEHLSQNVLWGLYWVTYLLGGVFFIVSSGLYLLETQPNWYTPAPHLLGWHVGLWNMIGSIGWTLAAAWGYCDSHTCEYQSNLTLIWASVAFLIGSMILWYEALDKYPVEKDGHKS